jgi:outer membrane protein assembly factor BamB
LAAYAQVTRDWQVRPLRGNGIPTSAAAFNGWVIFAVDKSVYLVDGSNGTPGGVFSAGDRIRQHPVPVRLHDDVEERALDRAFHVFVASDDGWLYKLNGALELSQQRDFRRGACGTDRLRAAPVPAHRGTQKIVIVATHHGCGDHTQNQIVALDAADITQPPRWVFNAGEHQVDAVESCLLDEARNAVVCVGGLVQGAQQNTVWSIDVATGVLNWAASIGAVQSRPAIGRSRTADRDRLYVGGLDGYLHAFDAETGTEVWKHRLESSNRAVVRNLSIGEGAYGGHVYAVDSAGVAHAVFDSGSEPVDAWRSPFSGITKVVTSVSVVASLGKGYVGLNNGFVHQLDLTSGADEARAYVTIAPKQGDMIADIATYDLAGKMKMVASGHSTTTGTTTVQYPIPCTLGASSCINRPPYVPPAQPVVPAPPPAAPPATPAPTRMSVPDCPRTAGRIVVPASLEWCSTGIKVSHRGHMTITALGRWSNAGPPRQGPEGFVGYKYPGTLLADADLASLVGKISETTFAIGARYAGESPDEGLLLLSINDVSGTFGDNQGYVEVSVALGDNPNKLAPIAYTAPTGPGGLPLDYCLKHGDVTSCGMQAANAFCTSKGHRSALSYKGYVIKPATVTVNGATCGGGQCWAFEEIVCQP